MRIISGTARGTKLYTLDNLNTRPTLDRVKESLFNIIQQDIQDSVFLDLFAGSGAIGLEAASRGAKKAILCDNSKEAINIIKKNTIKTHLENKVEIYLENYETLLKKIIKEKLDIIYIDPPYETDFAVKAVKIILEDLKEKINNNTKIIIETDHEEKIIEKLKNMPIELIDKRKYGRIHILFFKIEKPLTREE